MLNRSYTVLRFNPCRKKQAEQNACQKDGQFELKFSLQIPAQPAPFLGLMEKTTFVHLPKKSKYLKAVFLISFNIVDFERFVTSECNDTLILAIT